MTCRRGLPLTSELHVCLAQELQGLSPLPCHTELPTLTLPASALGLSSSVQFSSVAQSRLTLCDPMNCSTPSLLVQDQLPESTQTHVHRVSDATQPSHLLSSPSTPAPNSSQASESFPMSQLFARGGQSIGVSALASVLPVADFIFLGSKITSYSDYSHEIKRHLLLGTKV